jgi:Cu-Zn family superoxide dismutase
MQRLLVLVAVLTLGAATVAFAGSRGDGDRRGHHGKHRTATATLRDATGERVGHVWLKQHRRSVTVFAQVEGLPPGFHGFHIHTTGKCEPPTFESAGGHFNPTEEPHGDHAGDLSTLLVMEDGTATLATTTDRFSLRDLREGDGSAVMVHELADNYANIPDRYSSEPGESGPDEETLATGDAGSRLACGVLR